MPSNSTPFYARHGLIAAPGTRTIISVGNTGQRPGTPSPGEIRYNTDIGTYEFWFAGNTSWLSPSAGAVASNLVLTSLTSNVVSVVNSFSIGNVAANTTAISVGNSTVNSTISQGVVAVGTVTVNTSGFGIGNSTVSVVANSTTIVAGSTTLNGSSIVVGGGATINSTVFTGQSSTANNSAFLGGVAAASYVTSSALSSYQTTAGLATAVAGLSANNSTYLNGISAANYWLSTGTGALTKLSQLTNDSGFITGASIPTNISSFNNNVGYITGLNSGVSYNCYTLSAGNYLYSSGNIYAAGDVYCSYSDRRLKNLHGVMFDSLRKVQRLTGWHYTRNEVAKDLVPSDNKLRVGLIAQEVQEVLPEAVSYIKDGDGKDTEYLTVNHDMLIPLLVEAIKELKMEVEWLKSGGRF